MELKARRYTGALESVLNLYPFLDPAIKKAVHGQVEFAKELIQKAGTLEGVNRVATRKAQQAFLDRYGAPLLEELLDQMMDSIHEEGYFNFEKTLQSDINKEEFDDSEAERQ